MNSPIPEHQAIFDEIITEASDVTGRVYTGYAGTYGSDMQIVYEHGHNINIRITGNRAMVIPMLPSKITIDGRVKSLPSIPRRYELENPLSFAAFIKDAVDTIRGLNDRASK